MAKLFQRLPHSVCIDGKDYEINTDFRVWIEIEKLLCSSESDNVGKLAKCLALAYRELPPSPFAALEGLLNFYSAGQQNKVKITHHAPSAPLYDLETDAEYIYGSFMSQYGIDLSESELHWWKFRVLLACLNDDCKFAKVVSYRSTDTHDIKDIRQKHFYEKMKRLYALPDNRTAEEKEMALTESMGCLF